MTPQQRHRLRAFGDLELVTYAIESWQMHRAGYGAARDAYDTAEGYLWHRINAGLATAERDYWEEWVTDALAPKERPIDGGGSFGRWVPIYEPDDLDNPDDDDDCGGACCAS